MPVPSQEVRAFGKSLIKTGASYNEIIAQINQKIVQLKVRAAFPPQIALDHVAAHYLPMPGEDIVLSTEVVKLDIGVCYEGAIGDCAVTVDLSGKYQPLVDAAEASLSAAERIVKVGVPLGDIGKAIEDEISSRGFKPIKNLSGHGLGYYKIHTPPSIPNYNNLSKVIVKPGMTFAIEPFVTTGKGHVNESGYPTIFSYVKAGPVKLAITRAILTKIKTYNGLPFAVHELIGKEFSLDELQQGLDELINSRIITGYPPLVEEAKGMVAQAENSVLVDKNGNVLITTR